MKRSLWLVAVVVMLAALALAGVAAAAAGGSVTPRNDKASSDKVEIALTGLTAPAAGTVYVGWLVSADGAKTVNTGVLTVGADGSANATYTSPSGENLVGLYTKFVVTAEKDADKASAAPKGTAVLEAPNAPPLALTHVRHLDYQWDAAPNKTGLATGTLTQAQLASQHANFALDAAKAGNLVLAKTHAEHVLNIIEGSKGPNFGDIAGLGQVQNPGDGFGVLEYAKGTAQHANLAMSTADASAYVKLHAPHVIDTANNVIDWATQARDKALALAKAVDIAAATPLATDMAKFADLAYKGNSTKPAKGEGGALTVYEHAQNMGTFVVSAAAPAPATTAAPAAVPAALPKAGDQLPLGMILFGGLILVAVGTGVRILARRSS